MFVLILLNILTQLWEDLGLRDESLEEASPCYEEPKVRSERPAVCQEEHTAR